MMRTGFLLWVVLVSATAYAEDVAPPSPEALLMPFKQQLKQALVSGLQQGPEVALTACREKAPAIAAAQLREGISMGRSSHKLRNPANAPQDWLVPIMDGYRDHPGEKAPVQVRLPDNRIGYVEPIYVEPLCLTCHGSSVAPELGTRIRALYPEDQAIGYAPGDLRGVFWVTLPADIKL